MPKGQRPNFGMSKGQRTKGPMPNFEMPKGSMPKIKMCKFQMYREIECQKVKGQKR